MNSPVNIPFKSFILLKPEQNTAIYLQLVFEFIKAIQLGLLPEGTKLPGTRILCKLLAINRNTLIKAFQDLEAQGFIEIRPNKGTFILSAQKQAKKEYKTSTIDQTKSTIPVGFTFKHSEVLESPLEISELPLQFNDGLPDLRLVHTDILARLYVSKLKRQKHKRTFGQIEIQSHQHFKMQFTNFLNLTRSLRIAPSNLLTTANHETSLYLVTKLLISAGDKVVIASPSYYQSNMTLADSGAQLIPIPIDDEGIDTVLLRQICKAHSIRMLYLTSVYHYPTTTTLSAKRRMELLQLAQEYGFIILEDDYDFDFHYDNNPILPLAALDTHQSVVYIGSFARSLPVGFGYSFVAAPLAFIKELEKHKRILEPGIDVIKEQVLTDWIQDGEVHRLSKKNRKIYKERRDYFSLLLNKKLQGKVKFHVPPCGLAIWVEWIDTFNLIKLKQKCAMNGLFLPKTILYQSKHLTATRLGFGSLDQKEMEDAIEILSKSLQELTSNHSN